tara:strand:- start:900 stop:1844 length:945 start_codon:yes stop_codon:yes gene_type:complete
MKINKIYIAPMVGRTDVFFRTLVRVISDSINLYTEMTTCDAYLYTNRKYYKVDENEHHISIQLAGSDPKKFSQCAKIIKNNGYDEININVGCPSSKVVKGNFGACLMEKPEILSSIVEEITKHTNIPLSIKTRLGLNYDENLDLLVNLITKTSAVGCKKFVIHARNAILGGLSPKKNRSIPKIRYDDAERITKMFPDLEFVINGEIGEVQSIEKYLNIFDGVMIGRKIYDDPVFIQSMQVHLDGKASQMTRWEILEKYLDAIQLMKHYKSNYLLLRHLFGLYYNTPMSKMWKKLLHQTISSDSDIDKLRKFKEH